MSEELDNELRKRISEVFEQYEDTASAQEGWELLRKKFPAKKQRPIAPLWWSVAATLLVLSLFGLWFYNRPQKTEQVAVKPAGKILKPNNSAVVPQRVPLQTPYKNPVDNHEQEFAGTGNKPVGIATDLSVDRGIKLSLPPAKKIPANVLPIKYQQLAGTNNTTAPASTPDGKALLPATNNAKPDSTALTNKSILAQQTVKPQQKAEAVNPTDSLADESKSRMSIFLANERKKEVGKKTKNEKASADKRILYSVYAATYFNYAEGSKSQMNTGAGFGTDIKLFSHFKLSTGVAIAKNTLNYAKQPTLAGILQEAIGVSSIKANDATAYNTTPTLGFVSSRVVVNPVVAGYNVSLTGLDVPVNIKYEFNPQKSDSYISAGLSSGTFINETYNYRYENNINSLISTPAIPDATTRKSFTKFDFARTLNLSLGMGYQITKNNRLVIEPFLKYPLSGLGSQQIRFGAGGVNLRLKFQSVKK
ncbi:hypothetical protein ACFQ3S_12405 [Mucilaginibacter terrae]|uniref:hypothetical protein n=1 Tax=Mucilaginibacter terrae TaxID=1955052 RepID=UPI003636C88A